MPTTPPALLAQLQSLWQAATPIMPPASPKDRATAPPVAKNGEVIDRQRIERFRLGTPDDWAELQDEILGGILDGEICHDWVWRENTALVDGIERDDVPPESRWWRRATFDQLPYADGRLPRVVADDGDPFALIGDAEREYLLGRHRFPPPCGFCGGRSRHNPNCVALSEDWHVKMPWGKHRGKPIADTNPRYLRWLLKSGKELETELRREIERVLEIENDA